MCCEGNSLSSHFSVTAPLTSGFQKRSYTGFCGATNTPKFSIQLFVRSKMLSQRPMIIRSLCSTYTDEERSNVIKMEHELFKCEGKHPVPELLTDEDLTELLKFETVSQRIKYLRYLCIRSNQNKLFKERKRVKRALRDERFALRNEEVENCTHINYGLFRNSINLKYTNSVMKSVHNSKLVTAKLFGQKLVIDNSYEEFMDQACKSDLSKQIVRALVYNREHIDPLDIHICNFNREDKTSQLLMNEHPTLKNEDSLVETHKSDYLDVSNQ